MIDFRVRSVMSLSHLEIMLPFCDRYCVIECDSENRCYYRIPYHFSIAFLLKKALPQLPLSLLSPNTDIPSSAVESGACGFTAIRKRRSYYKASRARGFPPSHKIARENPQPLQFFRKERNKCAQGTLQYP